MATSGFSMRPERLNFLLLSFVVFSVSAYGFPTMDTTTLTELITSTTGSPHRELMTSTTGSPHTKLMTSTTGSPHTELMTSTTGGPTTTTVPTTQSNCTNPNMTQKEAEAELWKGVIEDDGLLIERAFHCGADLNGRDERGRAPLPEASKLGHEKAVSAFIKLGADLEKREDYYYLKNSALEYAAMYGRLSIVDQLIAAGAEVDSKDESGWTPLISAAFSGKLGVVKRLVEAGANVTAENKYGYTALHKAVIGHHQDVVDYLRSVGGCGKPPGCRWLDASWEELINS